MALNHKVLALALVLTTNHGLGVKILYFLYHLSTSNSSTVAEIFFIDIQFLSFVLFLHIHGEICSFALILKLIKKKLLKILANLQHISLSLGLGLDVRR